MYDIPCLCYKGMNVVTLYYPQLSQSCTFNSKDNIFIYIMEILEYNPFKTVSDPTKSNHFVP